MRIKFYFLFLTLFFVINSSAQKFYLGNYLMPTANEFEYLGTSSKTLVSTYRYKNNIYDRLFGREIGEIIVGIRDNHITTTIYNLIPNRSDVGIPEELKQKIQAEFPFPFKEVNGIFGLNVDNETISFARVSNSLTFGKDRIMFMTSVRQSFLEKTAK